MLAALICLVCFVLCGQVAALDHCYVCFAACQQPLIRNCRAANPTAELKCYTIQTVSASGTETEKGCLPAADADRKCADLTGHIGITCRTCDTELCNDVNHIRGSSVKTGVLGPLTLLWLALKLF